MEYRLNIGSCCCSLKKNGCNKTCNKKLNTYDWMSDLPETEGETDYVEVQFKNTRKGFFLNSTKIPLEKGDMVAVESAPGHDIGEVTLTGRLVLLQMKKDRVNPLKMEVRRVYRKAKKFDLDKYHEAKGREQEAMIKARQLAESLNLDMKIGDVEFQGDGNKAIFYYIANDRVDFRQLIKVFAETFRVRIEMKQIGARQEAGRVGGIGPCGRELCCSKYLKNFRSVSTSAARIQDISLNPQKLAGQCGKLKCCINFEVDSYADASKTLPSKEIRLETLDGTYYHFKTDVFKGLISYSTAPNFAANIVTITSERAREIIAMNREGRKADSLKDINEETVKPVIIDYENVVGQDSLTRFDTPNKRKPRKKTRPQLKAKPTEHKNEDVKKVEPRKIEARKVEPKNIEPRKVEPKNIEPRKVEPKNIEPKNIEPKTTEPKRPLRPLKPRRNNDK